MPTQATLSDNRLIKKIYAASYKVIKTIDQYYPSTPSAITPLKHLDDSNSVVHFRRQSGQTWLFTQCKLGRPSQDLNSQDTPLIGDLLINR